MPALALDCRCAVTWASSSSSAIESESAIARCICSSELSRPALLSPSVFRPLPLLPSAYSIPYTHTHICGGWDGREGRKVKMRKKERSRGRRRKGVLLTRNIAVCSDGHETAQRDTKRKGARGAHQKTRVMQVLPFGGRDEQQRTGWQTSSSGQAGRPAANGSQKRSPCFFASVASLLFTLRVRSSRDSVGYVNFPAHSSFVACENFLEPEERMKGRRKEEF